MNSLIRFAIGLAAVASVVSASADDLKVDMVVNLTEAGRKITRPDPAHPTYYYPISKGYTERGQVLNNMAPPPREWDVLHAISQALYGQGYRMASGDQQPELLLIFWWGYKAPVIADNTGAASPKSGFISGFAPANAPSKQGGGSGQALAIDPINHLMESGQVPTGTSLNGTDMEELVMGSAYETDFNSSTTLQNHPNIRLERLISAAHDPRYYVMISALDFNQALKNKFVVYWTARVSTPIYDHTLAQVIPTLVADVAPSLGREAGPEITDRPLAPEGNVIVGAPTLVTSHPDSAK